VLGGRIWPREVCRDRRNQQLRSLKLARHLKASGISVMELERPKRRHLRRKGKSPIPSTRRQRPGQCWLARRSESLRAATDEWR
jgi:hypothetical protein